MEEAITALKSIKIVNKMDINQFRLEKQEERYNKLEIELKNKNIELRQWNIKIIKMMGQLEIKLEWNLLNYLTEYKNLFGLLFDLFCSYRSMWNKEYLYPLIYKLLFDILIETLIELIHLKNKYH